MQDFTRRNFLRVTGAAAGLLGVTEFPTRLLGAVDEVDNPLGVYPNRDWERIYRDQYRYDSTFRYVCAPNDTHNCRVEAFVRNGVVVRLEQPYDVANYADLFGNKATCNWHPRMCPKGYTMHRRLYGPYRLRYPLVREGWKQWADDGFPELTPENLAKYKFDARGQDRFVRATWVDTFAYLAKGLHAIAKRYSGPEGAALLQQQGYQQEMIDAMGGAGTRTLKFRGGMGLLGVIGKYGMYRLSQTMALVDAQLRGVDEHEARGGRLWSNYTWHGDQAPGHPFVHGLQNSEVDFNDLRFSKLVVQTGKNLVENKMPESHWFIECMERGAKIVVITPEYSPPATKADYWIPIRPATDAALFLGVTKLMIDEGKFDRAFLSRFTDFPLLVRSDTLKRLQPQDFIAGYKPRDISAGPSMTRHGLTLQQREKVGDFVIWDRRSNQPVPITRDDVGDRFDSLTPALALASFNRDPTGSALKVGPDHDVDDRSDDALPVGSRLNEPIEPALEGTFEVTLVDGKTVEVLPLFEMYKLHLRDYDLDTVHEITHAPKDLIKQLADDFATIKPASVHCGEGINHWFHATEMNRSTYLPLILTGNIGIPGGGSHGWAGNYKAAVFQGSSWSGPGFKGWVAEDPFHPNLDENADGKDIVAHNFCKDEEPAYWNHGDKLLAVETPKFGRKVFTGNTHMPTPTKAMVFTNVNLINNAKHAYEMIKNVDPKVELIVSVDIEMTGSVEYADFGLPANSWLETETLEVTASCSNPFLQIWKGGIKPLYDTKDDVAILAGIAAALSDLTGDQRINDFWKFALDGRPEVYIQRLLDSSMTTRGYTVKDIMAGKYGEPGAALMLFRTYPRHPFWEQIHESQPFYTPTGRLQAYNDEPEVIEYGENFIVHREGPEATPYLPNVIVSSNPFIRPEDYGIPLDAMGVDERTIRNVKLPWAEVKQSQNPLWEKGFKFYCLTPKTRHRVHSQWSACDWHLIWESNFGDPYRMDKRCPGVGESQLHINPQAARDLGIADGDYVYVDANPADRPYVGWMPDDPFYKVARLMLRVKYNPAYPYSIVMMKHAPYIATERSVAAHESRPDGRALSAGTGYQANFRYGSQQSVTRNWHMPMHQTDSLFHKQKTSMTFIFGGEADNHAINTVPKETLVRVTKAEDGGLGGTGVWEPARTGMTPDSENEFMKKYLAGECVKVT